MFSRVRDCNLLMLKKVIIFVFVLLCLAAAGIYVITRPWFVAKAVQSVVNARVKDLQLRDLSFGKIGVNSNGLVTIKDARFALFDISLNGGISNRLLPQENQEWQGQIPVVYLDNLRSLLKSGKIIVSIERLDAVTDGVRLKRIFSQMTVILTGPKWHIPQGNVKGDFLSAAGITLSSFEAYFSGNENLLIADSWRAKWADGNLSGRLTVSPEAYTMHADMAQVDLSRIAPQTRDMSGRLDGKFDIDVQRATNTIGAFNGYLDAPQGAQLQAVLLQPLLTYIPASNQKSLLERLIAENANVFFDRANVRLENARNDTLHFFIEMDSRGLNLDIGVTVDLRVEGGLNGLLEPLSQFLS